METIKCEVIKDLLPLYVDDVLSKESRKLVEEHITTCTDCKACCEKLKATDVPMVTKDTVDEKKVIQNIRKSINKKRIIAIVLTAILLIALALGLGYGLFGKQSYLPYEETGLYVEDGKLHTKEPYYCYYAFESPEEGTLFIYMTTTVYESNGNRDKDVTVDELYRECNTEEVVRTDIKRIYYISKENVQVFKDGYYSIIKNQERLDELKKESILIWEGK